MDAQPPIINTIAMPTVASLHLTPTVNGLPLGSATGFVFYDGERPYLITNWHVLAGRDRLTGQPLDGKSGATPDAVIVRHHRTGAFFGDNYVVKVSEKLVDEDGEPLWLEHPQYGRRVDVAALPLPLRGEVRLIAYTDEHLSGAVRAEVSDGVSIVGYPFGLSAGGPYAVWIRGAIASERLVNFDNLPCFLVDARTRQGQSGSPVIVYSAGGMTPMADGSTALFGRPVMSLLGVYSGRINTESDLGHVWKASALREILTHGVRGCGDLTPRQQ